MLILVVDDDTLSRKLLREVLKELKNVQVVEAENAKTALEVIKTQNISAIFTDVEMPDMDGVKFVSVIRDFGIKTPVIFITGHADKDIAIKAVKLGAFDFIEKPFQNKAIIETVTKALVTGNPELMSKLQSLNLNAMQIRILDMLLKGLSNKEIADGVNLSEPGVKYHVKNLLKRFESSDRVELRGRVLRLLDPQKNDSAMRLAKVS